MSRKIPIFTLTQNQLSKISSDLTIPLPESKYAFNRNTTYIVLGSSDEKNIYVPFAYNPDFPRPERESLGHCKGIFTGELREEQKVVKSQAIENINTFGSVILALPCGFGKTCLGVYLTTKINLKTIVVCHRVILIKQWQEAFEKFSKNLKVCVPSTKTEDLPEADVYIINAINIPKRNRSVYNKIGLLIVDEAHLVMAKKLSECMHYITPRYAIGLSATPYREDGMDILLDMYFGKNKISRQLHRSHTVYEIKTSFTPEVKLNKMGKIDWGAVIEAQANNQRRNESIINLVKYLSNRVILILCKRVYQAQYIYDRLKEEKEDVTSLIGKQQSYEKKSRILVGTCQKAGVGFDHPRLDTLIIASDLEQYFVQYLGRVFRRQDSDPIVFDIVDNMPLLKKHYSTRKKVYIEHGGTVKDFSSVFTDFKFEC